MRDTGLVVAGNELVNTAPDLANEIGKPKQSKLFSEVPLSSPDQLRHLSIVFGSHDGLLRSFSYCTVDADCRELEHGSERGP